VAVQNPLRHSRLTSTRPSGVIEAQTGPVILAGHRMAGWHHGRRRQSESAAWSMSRIRAADGESVNGLGKGHPAPAWAAASRLTAQAIIL